MVGLFCWCSEEESTPKAAPYKQNAGSAILSGMQDRTAVRSGDAGRQLLLGKSYFLFSLVTV